MWHIHAIQYYLALKRREILTHTIICTKLSDIMLSERNQSQKEKCDPNHMKYLE
jgi:hypothetical protein